MLANVVNTSIEHKMVKPKLRVLCLHSFRTSAAIFKEQMRRSGLDRQLGDVLEFVYMDAPHEATGPPPADVTPFFEGPYRQWWATEEDPVTGRKNYEGGLESMEKLIQFLHQEGPFDGFWAFSQGTLLATILLMFQRQGKYLQGGKGLQFAVLFGGVFFSRVFESLNITADLVEDWKAGPLKIPSVHVIGQRDPVREHSKDLAQQFKDPIIISHPRGHNIPALSGKELQELREFLEFMSPATPRPQSSL